ncbi:MAG: RNA methyltransferase [Deltaproteobacteria bacterium]|nr:RNA methyltransferase [Deltaproteobacteria bacterium]
MNDSSTPSLYLALIHHPVLNKHLETIASAVTNLDLHDISRAARTFGAQALHIVTPLQDQQDLCRRIVDHWTNGWGATFNSDRKDALGLIRIQASLKAVKKEIEGREGTTPKTVATGARIDAAVKTKRLCFPDLRRHLRDRDSGPWLLLFGTAWGLSPPVMAAADHLLEPIAGNGNYNHLSVRSAAAIILDRLLGRDDK